MAEQMEFIQKVSRDATLVVTNPTVSHKLIFVKKNGSNSLLVPI